MTDLPTLLLFGVAASASAVFLNFLRRVHAPLPPSRARESPPPYPLAGSFSRIRASGAMSLMVVQDAGVPAGVEGPSNEASTLRVEVINGELVLTGSGPLSRPPEVTVTLASLEGLDVQGPVAAELEGVSQTKLDLVIGPGVILDVEGQVETLTLRVTGEAEVDLSCLMADTVDANLHTDTAIALNATRQLRLTQYGGGEVVVVGQPATREVHFFGAGTVFYE